MASFTTRVELHGATSQDYDVLHAWMHAEGFKRTIRAENGVEYHLPTAEYDLAGGYSVMMVRDKAARAASKTGRRFWILVTEAGPRAWMLDPVRVPAYS
jgi:hypothetical protein